MTHQAEEHTVRIIQWLFTNPLDVYVAHPSATDVDTEGLKDSLIKEQERLTLCLILGYVDLGKLTGGLTTFYWKFDAEAAVALLDCCNTKNSTWPSVLGLNIHHNQRLVGTFMTKYVSFDLVFSEGRLHALVSQVIILFKGWRVSSRER